ncbi:hypothetical protein E2C01_048708 [Portunus trituberculatus]|uniref:Uncharacterized protein n=1 Tax=Portunus trituberculatus TaxID=210409 RepID=A0A5B7G759_PORTR|nr:hypothetical protein [Portunus trituberculatus]
MVSLAEAATNTLLLLCDWSLRWSQCTPTPPVSLLFSMAFYEGLWLSLSLEGVHESLCAPQASRRIRTEGAMCLSRAADRPTLSGFLQSHSVPPEGPAR